MASYTIDDFVAHSANLATISPAAVELITKISLPNTTRDEIARLVAKDEILFANIFKIVNSASLSLVRRPKTIQEAVDILGTTQIRNLIFSVAARKVVADSSIWYRSVFTALAAEQIAREYKFSIEFCSDIYITGLSQALGELVFKTFYRKQYDQLENIKPYKIREKREKEIFGFTGSELSCALASSYKLPESVKKILSTQALEWNDPDFIYANAILDLAISISEIDEIDLNNQSDINSMINYPMLNRFGLDDIVVDSYLVLKFHRETKRFVAF